MLIPVVQKRGLMWDDYGVPGGIYQENLHNTPGNPYLNPRHPGSKLGWNAPETGVAAKMGNTPHAEVAVPV
jgi:hypothetical protein